MFEKTNIRANEQRDEKFLELGKQLHDFIDYKLKNLNQLVDGDHHSLKLEICCD